MDRVSWLVEGIASGCPAVASSVAFVAFGAVAAWLLGLRNPLLAAVAALPTGTGILVLTAHVVGTLGVRTTVVIDGFVALAAAAMIGTGRRAWMRRTAVEPPPASRGPSRLVWVGPAVGAAVAFAVWLAGIGEFLLPPQGTDDIWHGYLVERLTHMPFITSGTVAPNFVNSPEPVVFYQYGLHLSAAFIHELTGVSVPEVLNGAWVVYVGLLLPFGVAALAWQLFPNRPWVAFWSGALSSGVAIFPYVTNGILPYTAAVAMIPGVLALVAAFIENHLRVPMVILALAALGVFITHPAGAIAAVILVAMVTIEHLLRSVPARERLLTARRLGTVGVLAAIVAVPWVLAAGNVGITTLGEATTSATSGTGGELRPTAWMLLGLASPWTPPQPMLAFLTTIGVATSILSRRAIGVTAALMFFGALFIGTIAGIPRASEFTAPWNGDWYRLMAVVGMIVPVLAGLGAASIVAYSGQVVGRIAPSRETLARGMIALVVGALAGVGTAYDAAHAQSIVRSSWHSGLVTGQDVQVLGGLADRLGPADKVLNSPVDGSTWMYAMFGVTPILPYPAGSTLDLPDLFAGEGMYSDPRVICTTLAGTGATFALVKEVRGDSDDYDIAGFVGRNPGLFTEVLRAGGSAAYRIDQVSLAACAAG